MSMITVSPAPHDHSNESVSKLMFGVIIALVPTFIVSSIFFGIGVLIITLTSMLSCVAFEYLIQRFILKKEPSISDGSALVTGMLLALCLPADIPFWLVILGGLVAIGVAKMSFGGLGNNPFNPALVGRVFLFVSFPVQMSTYPEPLQNWFTYTDASTGATPLAMMKEGIKKGESVTDLMKNVPDYFDLFIGKMGGSAGEIAAFALIIGLIYLLARKIITIHIPVSIILTVTIFTGILWWSDPTKYANPLFHLLTGGLLLGAIFMATDYVTSPMTIGGMWIYGIGIGIITILIRVFGAYPEGVQFAILIMNAFVPLINKYIKPVRFGERPEYE
jgi:Na+-translocating ferredoxin:NAD+ oxidoreductase subunit D